MVDVTVSSGASWVCVTQDRRLADVVLSLHLSSEDSEAEELSQLQAAQTNIGSPVLLEQTETGSPCVLTVHCGPNPSTNISRVLVVSEARTLEVYDRLGEYCGTVRGERDNSVRPESEDRGPFYRKELTLDHPSSACDVKLLSLAGRSSVLVCRVIVGLQSQQPCPVRCPGIDMQQVHCLVEEMGTTLSPGAQNLMEMVHFQQKNQTGTLGGFLPLLMSTGAFSALCREPNTSSAAFRNQPQPAESRPLVDSVRPPEQVPPSQNGATSADSSSSSPDLPQSNVNRKNTMSHDQLAEMMSHFLTGQEHGLAFSCGPELLPILQSVCGQVTQLRLDETAAMAEKEKLMTNGTWELDSAMEQRLEEMEKRLKEHLDRRLDALEQKLEKVLLSSLPLVAVGSSVSGAASTGPSAVHPNTSYALKD